MNDQMNMTWIMINAWSKDSKHWEFKNERINWDLAAVLASYPHGSSSGSSTGSSTGSSGD